MGGFDALLNLGLKLLWSGYSVLSENFVVGFLVFLCGHIGFHVHHGEGEHRVQAFQLGFVYLEHGGAVRLIGKGGIHVQFKGVPGFFADESATSLFRHIGDAHIHAFCLMAFVGNVGHDVVVLAGLLAFLQRAVLLEQLLLLGLLLCGGDVNLVIRDFVVLVHLEGEFRRLGQVELEGEVLAGLPGQLRLVLRGKGLAHDTDFFLVDEFVQLLGHNPVHALVEGLVPVHTLDKAHRGHSATEAFDIGLALVLVQALAKRFLIICCCNVDGHLIVQGICLGFAYVHMIGCIIFSNKGRKDSKKMPKNQPFRLG